MYKRRAIGLHQAARPAAAAAGPPSAAGSTAAAPSAPNAATAPPDPGGQPPPPPAAAAVGDKENAGPALQQPLLTKRPKLFVPPAAARPPAAAAAAAAPRAASAAAPTAAAAGGSGDGRAFSVLYTKRAKFNKRSDRGWADGVLEVRPDGACVVLDMEGKVVTRGRPKLPPALQPGATLELGNFVMELDQALQYADFKSGTCFTSAPCNLLPGGGASSTCMLGIKPPSAAAAAAAAAGVQPLNASKKPNHLSSSRAALGSRPGGAGTAGLGQAAGAAAPQFDPAAPGALVLNNAQWQQGQGLLPNGRRVVPVVVDPYIGRHLRPHQREGVEFLFQTVMGLRDARHQGCLLADEMGLGKTLQVIALLWTLLRQGPEGQPVAQKAIVVAPATLVANWGKEVKKWLGPERLKFMQLSQGADVIAQQVSDFKLGKVWRLLIGSYEQLRKHGPALAGCCDILVCDEGHRLKAASGNKTIAGLQALGCDRRIVLTGTPVQNNLDEFYALLSFAAPGLLGSSAAFKRLYAAPITRSRDKDASAKEQELGEARAAELQRQVALYVLRRTQAVLAQHLPPLAVHTIFCKPSQLQLEVYRSVLSSKRFSSVLSRHGSGGGSDAEGVLPAITLLRKLCNHPALLVPDGGALPSADPEAEQGGRGQTVKLADVAASVLARQLASSGQQLLTVELSGKMATLAALLQSALAGGSRVVVVSTSTSALDLVDRLLCVPRGWRSVRIDGGTSVDERQTIVDNFNSRGIGDVFLLSTRAGGAGLNLIGASQLVLYDSDWNPAMDKQAMARIWRDGQKQPCFVHRLLTTGTMEEKVYQRQMMKSDLADATMASGSSGAGGLSHHDLKELFQLVTGDSCSTRPLLDACQAGGSVRWLQLGGGSGGDDGGGAGLPRMLAAAVAAGCVTDINREEAAGAAAATMDAAAAAGAAAGEADADAGGEAAAGGDDDVDALDVDEDW